MHQELSSAQRAIELVKIVQMLYQMGEIEPFQKKELANQIKVCSTGEKEFSSLVPDFRKLRLGATSAAKRHIDTAIKIAA